MLLAQKTEHESNHAAFEERSKAVLETSHLFLREEMTRTQVKITDMDAGIRSWTANTGARIATLDCNQHRCTNCNS